MNKFMSLILIVSGMMTAVSPVFAQSEQIYTWTDENGVKHFVDSAVDNPDAVIQQLSQPEESDSAFGDPANATGAPESAAETLSPGQQKREQLAQKRNERQLAQAEQDQICSQAQAALTNVEPSRRVLFTNDEGETVRMDDADRMRVINESKALIAENCH
jgi:hypothetical protein